MQIKWKRGISESSSVIFSRLLPVTITVTVLHFIFLSLADSIPGHKFVFLLFFLTLILFPGFLIVQLLFKTARIYYKIFLSLSLGSSAAFLCLIIFTLFRLDIHYFSIVIPIISLLIALVYDYGSVSGFKIPENQPLSVVAFAVLVIIVIAVTVIILGIGDPILYTSDSPDHIAYIRAVTGTGEVFPEQFLYKNGGSLTRDLRKGLYHSIWGAINLSTGKIDVHTVWPLFSWTGSVFLLLGIFCFSVQFFRSQSIGIIGMILYLLLYQGGQAGHQLIMNGFGFYFGKIFLFGSLMFIPAYLRSQRKALLLLITVFSFAATGTHISYMMITLFGIFIFSLLEWFQADLPGERNSLIKPAILLFGTVILINLPYVLIRYIRDYNPVNEIHTDLHGLLHLTENFSVVNPVLFFNTNGFLMAVSFFCIFILWKRSRTDRNLRIALGSTASIYLLVFNPLWVPFIMGKITYLIVRFAAIVPTMLIAAYLIKYLWTNNIRHVKGYSRFSIITGWIVLIFFIVIPSLSNFNSFAYMGERRRTYEKQSALNHDDLYSQINRNIPAGNIFASDPITSYCIPAFCDQFVICTYDQHSTPNDSTALDRIMDCRDIFLPTVSCREIADIIEKYNAGYVVINGRLPEWIGSDYWNPDSEIAGRAYEKLTRCGNIFKLIYSSDSVYLFEYLGDNDSSVDSDLVSQRFADDCIVGEFSGKYEQLIESETEGIFIRDFGTENDTVQRGDSLALFVEWVSGRIQSRGNYTIHIRFDTEFDRGSLYSIHYSKLYRKVLEKIEGVRYRFRVDRLPFGGVFPPDKWRVNAIIRENICVPIPKDISPGRYTISIKMDRYPHKPDYWIKDFLSDDDLYDGPDLMEVTID